MARVRFSFDATACADPLAALSAKLPDEVFTICSSHPTDDGIVGLIELDTTTPEMVKRAFEDASSVTYELLYEDGQTLAIQYLIPPTETNRILRSVGVLPRFPATLQDGWLRAEHTGSHEQLAQLPEEMAAAGIPYEIESITQTYDPRELLTDRQHEFITAALEQGYYASPRECTLTELADEFGVNPSAASGVLHRAEATLIKESFSESLPFDDHHQDD
ncbi:helix-turn-helix domain-containing protein [Halocatena halophila]|uniref:helix-turn-helix domain-containing protein n=1 Tax=Halocatena halophila TaxID=2814576 RepID=UPI002ED0D7A8